jgi:hypothetical protein
MASASPASTEKSNIPWWMAEPVIEEHGGVLVVRDDLLAGGSKIRFLPHIVGDAKEVVFGGPFCGGAPYALAVWGARMRIRITLFYAKRKDFHWRQRAAFRLGAQLFQVPAGRMAVVQHRARTYAADHGALPERALCYLDTRKPHAVINPGAADRIHLVIDTYAGPELRRMIAPR